MQLTLTTVRKNTNYKLRFEICRSSFKDYIGAEVLSQIKLLRSKVQLGGSNDI